MTLSRRCRPSDLMSSGGLPAEAYLSAERLAAERAAVFGRSWQLVCCESDLPSAGAYVTADCGSEPVVLVRQHDGTVKALSAVCLHRGGPVAEGCGQASSLRCAYHGWVYDLTGRLVDQPRHLAADASWVLPTFATLSVPPFVFVRATGNSAPPIGLIGLTTALDSMGHIRQGRRERRAYVVRANWKLVVENFLECVHCQFVHPATVARNLDLDHFEFEIGADSIRYDVRPAGAFAARPIFAIYPNIAISLLPGLLVTFHAQPVDVMTTRVVRDFLTMEGVDTPTDERFLATMDYFDQIMREDIHLLEAVHRNMSSGVYRPGGYLPGEAPVEWFHVRLASDLAGATGH